MTEQPDSRRGKVDAVYERLRVELVEAIAHALDTGVISYAEIIGLMEQIKWGVLMTSNRITRDLADKKQQEPDPQINDD